MQEVWLVFSNVSKQNKKKGRKKENNILFLYNYILRAFHVMIHFSLCVCVCVIPSYISVSHAPPPPKRKKFDNNSEMGLLLLLTWFVSTLFGVNLTLKVE